MHESSTNSQKPDIKLLSQMTKMQGGEFNSSINFCDEWHQSKCDATQVL